MLDFFTEFITPVLEHKSSDSSSQSSNYNAISHVVIIRRKETKSQKYYICCSACILSSNKLITTGNCAIGMHVAFKSMNMNDTKGDPEYTIDVESIANYKVGSCLQIKNINIPTGDMFNKQTPQNYGIIIVSYKIC